jgi:hypothetical protein
MVLNIKENINELLVERLFRGFDDTKLVNWARTMLDAGNYAESLIILANLENSTKDEIEKYFLRSVEELEFPEPKALEKQLEEYANEITRKVLNAEIPQSQGFELMVNVARVSNKDFRYQGFAEIDEDLKSLALNGKIKRDGLRLDNEQNYIREEFKLFSVMEMLNIPMTLRRQEYCLVCGQLTTPFEKKKYQVSRPFMYHVSSCNNCQSERLKSASQHFVKRKIIDNYAWLCDMK